MGNQFAVSPGEVLFEAEDQYTELLIGCGNDHRKILSSVDNPELKEWQNLTTLDMDVHCNPDVLWDLNHLPLPFQAGSFNEIHAYEVLEHIGQQGDYRTFFAQFTEFHRLLKKDGLFFASVPCWDSPWAWGDPGHTRVITAGTLSFLEQASYGKERNPMTDYRSVYKVDFEVLGGEEKDQRMYFVLRKK